MLIKMMKSLGLGFALSALMVSGSAFAAPTQSGTLTITGVLPLDAHVTIAGLDPDTLGAGNTTEIDGAAAALATFNLLVQAAPQTKNGVFSVTWDANGSGTNTVELSSANVGVLANGGSTIAYQLNCALCANITATPTALTGALVLWDSNAGLTTARALTFDVVVPNTTVGLVAGNYTDTITVTVSAV